MKNMDRYFIVLTGSLMDHIIEDYLPHNPSFMPEWTIRMLFFWNSAIISLHLRQSMLPSASFLFFYKVSQLYSSFLLITNFFLVWLLMDLFKFDSDFGLFGSCYLYNIFLRNLSPNIVNVLHLFHVHYLTCSHLAILILLFFHRYRFTNHIIF